MSIGTTVPDRPATSDVDYQRLITLMQARITALAGEPLFTTHSGNLMDLFLAGLPADQVQLHTCHACRRFFEQYGGLVTIDADGIQRSAFWDLVEIPESYRLAVSYVTRVVENITVTGVFHTRQAVWGQPTTGPWTHLAVTPPARFLDTGRVNSLKTPNERWAESREDHRLLAGALREYPKPLVERAVALLRSDEFYRGQEKVLGPAEWLLGLHQTITSDRGAHNTPRSHARDNQIWRAVATAPAGFCHVSSTMIGTLLDDLASGLSLSEVKRRFDQKMHPLRYQRPQAAPGEGNVKRAEQIVEQLNLAPAFARRYARLADLQLLWSPRPAQPAVARDGVFGGVETKQQRAQRGADTPVARATAKTMTWARFQRDVLPHLERLEYQVPSGVADFFALVTAVNPDSELLFQWDNRVNHYVRVNGSRAAEWGVQAGTYVDVTGITLAPHMWSGTPLHNHHRWVGFLLRGAYDHSKGGGNALFPEILRGDLREVRATIERYAASATIAEREQAEGCGIRVVDGIATPPLTFRAHLVGNVVQDVAIDRWD